MWNTLDNVSPFADKEVPPPGLMKQDVSTEDCYRLGRVAFGSVLLLLVACLFSPAESRATNGTMVLSEPAENYVTGLFQQQILATSTATTSNGVTIYEPVISGTTNSIVPTRMASPALISDTNFFSLLSQSIGSADANASAESTTAPASNGLFLSPGFWDAPVLTGTATGAFAGAAVSSLPNWIYVTATGVGGSALQTGTSTIGRFAYNVYNIGGLLNANVAGYPSAYVTGGGPLGALKGTAAGADLTQLGVPQSAIDTLIAWRNPQASGTNYASIVAASASNGFLYSSSGPYTNNYFTSRQSLLTYAAQNDPSLESALPYLTSFSLAANAPSWKPPAYLSGSSTGALTVSGTATPSNPDILSVRCATTGTYTHYDDNGNASTYLITAGQPLVQHRFSLAKLSWITPNGPGVSSNGTTISAAAIQACFGLVWNPNATGPGGGFTSPRWEYTQLNTSGTAPTIMRLDQVAALSGTAAREPNFFELLKAGLLWGSLGRDPGPLAIGAVYLNGILTRQGVAGYGFESWSAYQDMQVLQIGVNLIDQVTPYNYPNAIYGGTGTTTIIPTGGITDSYLLAQLQTIQTVYGTKDLPYLYGTTSISAYSDAQKHLAGWIQPSIWNPTAQSTAPMPSTFRVNTYGQAYMLWNYFYDTLWLRATPTSVVTGTYYGPVRNASGQSTWVTSTNSLNPYVYPYQGPTTSFLGGASGQIEFLTATATLSRVQPVPLDSANTSGAIPLTVSPLFNRYINSAPSNYLLTTTNALTPASDGGYPVGINIRGDQTDVAPVVYDDPYFRTTGTYNGYVGQRTTGAIFGGVIPYSSQSTYPGLTFTLEYQNPVDGTWRPYSRIAKNDTLALGDQLHSIGIIPNQYSIPSVFATPAYSPQQGQATSFHVDARTDRFSTSLGLISYSSYFGSGISLNQSARPYQSGTFTSSDWPDPVGSCGNPGGFSYVYLQPGSIPANWIYYNNLLSDFFRNVPITSGSSDASYSDPDGVTRPADGALANLATGDGCPIYNGTANPTTSVQRPVVLNRPFRSLAEMGYAFRDTPFASLDFAPPNSPGDSADTALLDLFCLNDTSQVAGNVNINAAPAPVLQALLSQAPEDDSVGGTNTLTSAEAATIASDLVSTTGTGALLTAADMAYPLSHAMQSVGSSYEVANKNCREAPIRALASSADTRTWNLLVDVVAQSGSMPATGTPSASSFIVQGENRYWLQVAIDRYTGQVVGQSLEVVPTGPVTLNFTATSSSTVQIAENQAAGSSVATFTAADSGSNNTLTYALVSGSGGADNASFTISGNTLQTAGVLQYLTQSAYQILVQVTDQNGKTFQEPLTVTLSASPYTQWKIANFAGSAANAAIAGDTVAPAGDSIPNLAKYALGLNPWVPSATGISGTLAGGVLMMTYPKADAATDVTVQPAWSSDLQHWSTTGVTATMLSDKNAIQLWQATAPADSQPPPQFMRLQITNP
jgi:hypothetical protein